MFSRMCSAGMVRNNKFEKIKIKIKQNFVKIEIFFPKVILFRCPSRIV